jgi:polysaccharide biosynthesis transport protein
MDTIDRSESNLPSPFPVAPSPLPALAPVFSGDLATTSSPQINSRAVLRGLTRYWWQILLVWVVLSAPAVYLIFRFVEPTYEASSTLLIEPVQREIFTPTREMVESRAVIPYLWTQTRLITTDRVLGDAIAHPDIVKLSVIKQLDDPKNDLRKMMTVEPVKDAFLIRVALALSDGHQAASIVNAVVRSYLSYNDEFKRSANSRLRASLGQQKDKLQNEVKEQQAQLKDLYAKGTIDPVKKSLVSVNAPKNDDDAPTPTLSSVTMEQCQMIAGELMRTELDLVEAEANLKVARDAVNQVNEEDKGQQESRQHDEREHRIQEEFQKDPQVITLTEEIAAAEEQRDHVRSLARQPNDPARRAAEARYKKLWAQYQKLWTDRYDEIGKQLKSAATGAPRAQEAIYGLKLKVDALKAKKQEQAKLYDALKVEKKAVNNDAFETFVVTHQLEITQRREDQVKAHLQQLEFEASQDIYRVQLVDAAVAPRSPTDNKRLKYMAAAPVALLFMVLGLFFLLEVKSERIADLDTLSTRVRSEVYALPPLPNARSIRNSRSSAADDQIEQFIQRLDHLRFAVCGNPSQLGRGRCVLITSAVGGEGKTTLAAQLAARCGRAGMSTLLIDADLRRSTLCEALDVPEGQGLSDVLKDEATATFDEVVIPIQERDFDLLPAGTSEDASRLLESRKLGSLITELRQRYDLIIIDSPPVLPVPDALILGQWADGAVLAARFDRSRFPQVERARRQLDNAGIAILGTVITGMRHTDSYYGRYSYSRQRSAQPSSSGHDLES